MPRALNKMTKGGVGYKRPPEIEASIDVTLGQKPEEQLRRANIRDPADSAYMSSECLVHLVREARLSGDKRAVDRLLIPLLSRCERRLKRTIPDSRPDAQGLRDEVLQTFCELLARVGTNQDATALDLFECKFNKGLATLRYRRMRKENNRGKLFRDIGREVDEDGQPVDPNDTLGRLSRAAQTPAGQEDFVHLAEMLEAIKELPPAQRKAVELCCLQGYAPGSEDPNEITAATMCGVSGTAIRKNLRKAAEKLKAR
jgi:DNA-directed RNA polymerase specialized sigma24 family protein